MQFLGDSPEKIAFEKAGIIKPGVPVVIGETQEDTKPVFLQKAASCLSEILFADQHFRVVNFEPSGKYGDKRSMDIYHDGIPLLTQLVSPLAGLYQRKNIVTVFAACEQLTNQGIELSPAMARTGIKNVIRNTGLTGRWQILARNPLTICDTGHNEGGLQEVLLQIGSTPHDSLHFVFGVVNDKNLAPILHMLPRNGIYYFCKPAIPRGLDAAGLKHEANAAGLTGESYPSVQAALKAAQKAAGDNDLVFVGGSTFVVAEVV
jgi:dihydrofolate synthase / folylpolyglutamate synthase